MKNTYYKYPRTFHLPFSEGATDDDKTYSWERLEESRLGQSDDVVVTVKMDGENTSIYSDHVHARSLDSRHHASRDWVKQLQGRIGHQIPEGWRVCGENLYARHSIEYDDLKSYFYVFSIWDDENKALSWDETLEWCGLLGLTAVEALYRGPFDRSILENLAETLDTEVHEGFVVRIADQFSYEEFGGSLAKWVRANHVQTDQHWMHAAIVPNGLSDD